MDLGGQEQAQRQSVINAPLTTAANAAQLLRGYTVPTSTAQEYKGPLPGAYAASPLQQIAGLGALFASGSGGTSPFQGFQKALNTALAPNVSNLLLDQRVNMPSDITQMEWES